MIQAFGRAFVPIKAAFEVEVLGLAIGGGMLVFRRWNRLRAHGGAAIARAEEPRGEKQDQQGQDEDQSTPE